MYYALRWDADPRPEAGAILNWDLGRDQPMVKYMDRACSVSHAQTADYIPLVYFRLGSEFFGSFSRLEPKITAQQQSCTQSLCTPPTGPITGRSCRCMSTCVPFASRVNNLLCCMCNSNVPTETSNETIQQPVIMSHVNCEAGS